MTTALESTLLQINDLTVEFGPGAERTRAVSNVSFSVDRGEIVAVVGESGSGKSVTALSLLRLLSKKDTHYPTGELLFKSIDLLKLPEQEMQRVRGKDIAMIFQEPMTSLNPVFTSGHQVTEAIRLHQKVGAKEAKAQALELFRRVRLPDPAALYRRYPHELSGGQKQRVMIAMAISCNPSLLIADEPTTALDVTVQKNVLALLADLQQQTGMGMLFITHDLGVVRDIAHKVVVMFRGSVVEQNYTDALFRDPQHPYTRALLACRPMLYPKGVRLPVVADFWQPGESVTEVREVQHRVSPPPPGQPARPQPLIRVTDLKVWFPAEKNLLGKATRYIKAVDGISFDIEEGETLGVVGESGCGKTTLGRALLSLLPVTNGSILYRDKDLLSLEKGALKQLRKDIQVVFQDPYASLNPRMAVGEAIREAMDVHNILSTKTSRREKVVELLEKVNLRADHYYRYPHAFSGGQRQRIGIARALALNPGFIVFDESVSALDVSVQAQVLNLINDLKAEFGFTALFISHDLGVVRYISDRILVMNRGRAEELGPAEQVFQNPASAYTRQLLEAIPGKVTGK